MTKDKSLLSIVLIITIGLMIGTVYTWMVIIPSELQTNEEEAHIVSANWIATPVNEQTCSDAGIQIGRLRMDPNVLDSNRVIMLDGMMEFYSQCVENLNIFGDKSLKETLAWTNPPPTNITGYTSGEKP